jgi:hypothetical protein
MRVGSRGMTTSQYGGRGLGSASTDFQFHSIIYNHEILMKKKVQKMHDQWIDNSKKKLSLKLYLTDGI